MPKLSPVEQQRRRARVLDAAETCFARAGFHRTTMQDICREAGISAGALYVYFRSKEDLIEGLSQRDRTDVLAQFAEASRGDDLVTGLTQVLRSCVIERPRAKTSLLLEIGSEATRNPKVADTLRACDGAIRAQLEHMLAEAAARGQIAPLMSVPELARLMSLVVDGLFWRSVTDPGFDGTALAPHVIEMLACAMRPVPAAKSVDDVAPRARSKRSAAKGGSPAPRETPQGKLQDKPQERRRENRLAKPRGEERGSPRPEPSSRSTEPAS
jgi:AcrR family transcriptional regulator